MKLIFAGTTENAVEVLRYLAEQSSHEILAVLTRKDAPVGRKQLVTPSAVASYALGAGIPIIRANRLNAEVDQQIGALGADLGVVVAYGALLPMSTLEIPTHGWVNIHYSLLPKLRGAAPVQRALISGEKETGVTIFRLDEGMDTGSIYSQVETQIEPDENAGDLLSRLTKIAITMLDETLARIESGFQEPRAQVGEASLASKLSRSDAKINFNLKAIEIENLVRGCNPEPMAWAEHEGQPIRVIRARALPQDSLIENTRKAGLVFGHEDKVLIATGGDGLIQIIDVQPASKRTMSASDWLRGTKGSVVLS